MNFWNKNKIFKLFLITLVVFSTLFLAGKARAKDTTFQNQQIIKEEQTETTAAIENAKNSIGAAPLITDKNKIKEIGDNLAIAIPYIDKKIDEQSKLITDFKKQQDEVKKKMSRTGLFDNAEEAQAKIDYYKIENQLKTENYVLYDLKEKKAVLDLEKARISGDQKQVNDAITKLAEARVNLGSNDHRNDVDTSFSGIMTTAVSSLVGDKCTWATPGMHCLFDLMSWALTAVRYFLTTLLSYTAAAFNISIDISINNLSGFLFSIKSIDIAWKVLRDLCNMFFLLVMMYISIGTVLQLDGVNWKKQIVTLIFSALLINFSMTITRVVIDTSNIFAVYFYEQAGGEMVGVNLIKKVEIDTNLAGLKETEGTSSLEGLVSMIGTLILLVSTIFVLLAGAILIIIRMVSLVFLLIFSPLPWLGDAIPKFGGKITGSYWNELMDQSLFAPAYMFCLYFAMTVIKCTNVSLLGTFSQDKFSYKVPGVSIIMYNAIVISLMLGAIAAAKKMSAAGASFATSTAGGIVGGLTAGAAGFAGRQTIGRIAGSDTVTDWLKDQKKKGGATGYLAETASDYIVDPMAKGTYDIRGTKAAESFEKASDANFGKAGSGMIFGEGWVGGSKGYAGGLAAAKKAERQAEIDERKEATETNIEDAKKEIVRLASTPGANPDDIRKNLGYLNKDNFLATVEKNPTLLINNDITKWLSEDQIKTLTDPSNKKSYDALEKQLLPKTQNPNDNNNPYTKLSDYLEDQMGGNTKNKSGRSYAEVKRAKRALDSAVNSGLTTGNFGGVTSIITGLAAGKITDIADDLFDSTGALKGGVVEALGPKELGELIIGKSLNNTQTTELGSKVRARLDTIRNGTTTEEDDISKDRIPDPAGGTMDDPGGAMEPHPITRQPRIKQVPKTISVKIRVPAEMKQDPKKTGDLLFKDKQLQKLSEYLDGQKIF
ncbi:MAG: hypothetical protein WCO84_03840 [bacterium]